MATELISMNTPKAQKLLNLEKSAHPYSIAKVRVIIRVRPFLPHEIQAENGNPTPCAFVLDQDCDSGGEVAVHLKDQLSSRNECYKLDAFFEQEDNNVRQIFTTEVSPLIPGIFGGRNATVFAYGATGSGKTYTMQGTDEMPGLISLAVSTVLNLCHNRDIATEISYYEVYMDKCYDLLELKQKEIMILDDKDGHVHLKGLSRVSVKSMSEFFEVFSCGIQRRKVAHTGLNDVSSRSHGVLTISVSTPNCNGDSSIVVGKLNLIDLAGNEDNRRTLNEGIRLQESAKINQSLFALSNVIYALNNNLPRIPFRESKLTRILQDSLSGNSRALMVACLNPGEYQEAVHTVSLAARSRHIHNFNPSAQKQVTSQIKVDMEAKLRVWLESKGKTKNTQQKMAAFGSPFLSKTPSSSNLIKKLNMCYSSAKSKPKTNQSIRKNKDGNLSVSRENTINNGINAWFENLDLACKFDEQKDIKNAENGDVLDEQMEKEESTNAMKSNTYFTGSPSPINGINKACEISQRNVLSPINSNIERNTISSGSFDPKTPKKFVVLPSEEFEFQMTTPLQKFNASSNNLKSTLVHDYVDFLNTASQEELVEINGIGSKIAEYIVELRETSPLRSLNDLEKIGLSSKQVHNMFSRAARGIFK